MQKARQRKANKGNKNSSAVCVKVHAYNNDDVKRKVQNRRGEMALQASRLVLGKRSTNPFFKSIDTTKDQGSITSLSLSLSQFSLSLSLSLSLRHTYSWTIYII